MRSRRVDRARGPHLALVLAIVALLVASTGVVITEHLGPADPPTAAAALGPTAVEDPVPADLDPLEGLVVDIPVPDAVDPVVELPQPEDAPTNPYAATPEVRHGQLEIPAIGLSQPFFEGVTLTAINRGPSHWPGTAMPGEVGNVVIAGHRTTYTKPFWSLNELEPGDELIFTVDGERITYVLERLEIIYPTDIHIVNQTAERRATLFGCHPRGSARQRIVGHFVIESSVSAELFDIGDVSRRIADRF